MKRCVAVAVLLFCCASVSAQTLDSKFGRAAIGEKAYPPAPRLSAQIEIAPAVVLSPSTTSVPDLIDSVRQWNAAGKLPVKNGFVRSTIDPVAVSLRANVFAKGPSLYGRGYVATTTNGVTWSGSVKVERAAELRLHLENVTVPSGTVMWVYGNTGEALAFDSSLIDDHGGLWTPIVEGDTIHLEIEIPQRGGDASFVIRELLEIIANSFTPVSSDISCLIDAACVTTTTMSKIDVLKGATAQLQYVRNGSGYICSGGLLNDRAGDFIPYLLTANHCIADQASASSLQATWDYIRSSCNGAIPSRLSFPRSNGATLLSTSANSDFTLLRLNDAPGNRWYLGWTQKTLTPGLALYRVSHPAPDEYGFALPQTYSTTFVDTTSTTCTGSPRPNTLYSSHDQGATWGGSSGSPVVLVEEGTTRVVGQLTGKCYFVGATDCDYRTRSMDGAFSLTYSAITPWLEAGGSSAVCTQSATTMCLSNDRFAVSATWQTADGNSGSGQAVRLTADTGYFWFFQSSNVEAVVKVLNACTFNQRIWVFAGGLTNVNVVLTVRDTKTGTVKTYTNPQGLAFQPIQDTSAFAGCP